MRNGEQTLRQPFYLLVVKNASSIPEKKKATACFPRCNESQRYNSIAVLVLFVIPCFTLLTGILLQENNVFRFSCKPSYGSGNIANVNPI